MNPIIVGNMGNFSNISMKEINIDNNGLGSDFLERERYLKFLYKLRFGLQCDVACAFFVCYLLEILMSNTKVIFSESIFK